MKPQQNQTTPQGLMPNLGNQAQSMTSLEIAELVCKRHNNVKRTIETLIKSQVIRNAQIEFSEKINNLGLPSKVGVYNFTGEQGKRDSIIVVAQLCPEFTAKLVDRWKELEEQIAKPIDPMQALSDPNTLRTLLLGYSEKMLELENKVGDMQNTVNAHERLTKAEGSLCITDSAKALQVNPKRLFALLSEKKWIYKRVGSAHWVGYQDKVQTGYLEHKVTEVTRGDGTTKITEQVRITPKGLTKISQLLSH